MARPIFWPTSDSYVRSTTGYLVAGVPVRIWARQTGGAQVTDLVYVAADGSTGAAVAGGVLTSDQNGLIPAFGGPDGGSTTLWGDHGMSGERIALTSGPTGGGGGGGGGLSTDGGGTVTSTSAAAADPAFTGRYGPAVGSDAWLKAWGANIDSLIQATTITRSGTDAATSANVIWPDGTAGVYTGTESVTTSGAIDSYTVTYLGASNTPATTNRTVTQPTLTRSGSGAVTTRPAMTVS